ncbi:hypothetical protein SPFM1_00068 [Salmonella phage SPFM1]|nr:hypothetical protein SPFM1_00068 [Salmonella phage SPFM1]
MQPLTISKLGEFTTMLRHLEAQVWEHIVSGPLKEAWEHLNRDEYKEMYIKAFDEMKDIEMMIKMSGPEASKMGRFSLELKTDEVIDKVGAQRIACFEYNDEDIEDGFLHLAGLISAAYVNIAVNEVHQLFEFKRKCEDYLIPKNIDRQQMKIFIDLLDDEFREIFPAAFAGYLSS